MSAADTVADLVGAMHAVRAATDSEAAYRRHRTGRPSNDSARRVLVAEHMLSGWSDPPMQNQRPSGRIAHQCRPLSELEAVGWRFLPIPVLHEWAELLGPRMCWVGKTEWLVIPPQDSGLTARRFKGPGLAQLWATEQLTAAGAAQRGAA